MSPPGSERGALRARLAWLRLLGVEELAVRPAHHTAAPRETISIQRDLFAEVRTFGKPTANPSALFAARAPEAPGAATALRLIRDEIGDCRRCRLCEERKNIVFGVGDPNARLMFIGEGPGVDEDQQGEPFVGRAGHLLTKIIESMGLTRQQVYIANVVKCRPPDNRTPLLDEVATCSPFLFQQIAAIRPRVIVCLGTPAAQAVLGTRETITHLRGRFREGNGMCVMPTFHPAYLLRNPAAKKEVWEDMKKVVAFLKTAG